MIKLKSEDSKRVEVVGVVNITTDSFSDGGIFLDTDRAIEHAEHLLADGADILDLGAAASNPHAEPVSVGEEIKRLEPVVAHLKKKGARISIDTSKKDVQLWAIGEGVEFINDIKGFPDASIYPALATSNCKFVVMHCISDLDKAVRRPKSSEEVLGSIHNFFTARLEQLRSAGIPDERLILDPGMGFFLASNPEPSFAVLASITELRKMFGLPVYVGVSRKSFLKNVGKIERRDIQVRTLAAELYAAAHGVSYIRTHDVYKLREALLIENMITSMLESSDSE